MGRLVVDTNALIQSLPSRSKYHDLWLSLLDGRNSLCVTTDILEEYNEIIALKSSPQVTSLVISNIINNNNTLFIDPFFNFNLIDADPDDNKFVDCAVAAHAKFIVSEDRHFDVLKHIDFPKVDVVSLDQILSLIHQ